MAAILAVQWEVHAGAAADSSTSADSGSPRSPDTQPSGGPSTRKSDRGVAESSTVWKDGDEVFAIDPRLLVGIVFRTADRTIAVDRSVGSHRGFRMTVTARSTGGVQQCRADAIMRLLLRSLSSVRVKRTFTAAEADEFWTRHGQSSALLLIRDSIDIDPKEFEVVLHGGSGPRDGYAVVFREQGHLFVPSVDAGLIKRLGSGCSGAIAPRRP